MPDDMWGTDEIRLSELTGTRDADHHFGCLPRLLMSLATGTRLSCHCCASARDERSMRIGMSLARTAASPAQKIIVNTVVSVMDA